MELKKQSVWQLEYKMVQKKKNILEIQGIS
jgi:hypothetical protein